MDCCVYMRLMRAIAVNQMQPPCDVVSTVLARVELQTALRTRYTYQRGARSSERQAEYAFKVVMNSRGQRIFERRAGALRLGKHRRYLDTVLFRFCGCASVVVLQIIQAWD